MTTNMDVIEYSRVLGFVFAVLGAFCNGSFMVFSKLESVSAVNMPPIVFNTYLAFGVGKDDGNKF